MMIALAIALCLSVLALAAVACLALWQAGVTLRTQRLALLEAGKRQDAMQARWLADRLDARASPMLAAQALDQARPAQPIPSVWPPDAQVPFDQVEELAG